MKVEKKTWTSLNGWEHYSANSIEGDADLVMAFGSRELLESSDWATEIKPDLFDLEIYVLATLLADTLHFPNQNER